MLGRIYLRQCIKIFILNVAKKKKLRAFSILESAFALLLIGIFSAILIPYWQLLHAQENYCITQNRANYIRKAVEGYVARHGFLPYAGDEKGMDIEGKLRGFVPYRTLGIPKMYIYDGYGKPFSFIVNQCLVGKCWKKLGYHIIPITVPVSIHQEHIMTKAAISKPKITLGVSFNRLYQFSTSYENARWFKHPIPEQVKVENAIKYSKTMFEDGYPFEVKEGLEWMTFIVDDYDRLKNINRLFVMKDKKSILQPTIIHIYDKFRYDPEERFDEESFALAKIIFTLREDWDDSYDAIAWVLISHHKNSKVNEGADREISLNSSDLIFWQSRFNLAAQIKCPPTSQPMDCSIVDYEKVWGSTVGYMSKYRRNFPIWENHNNTKPNLILRKCSKLREEVAESAMKEGTQENAKENLK